MVIKNKDAATVLLIVAAVALGCKSFGGANSNALAKPDAAANTTSDTMTANTTESPEQTSSSDGTIPSGTGVEKEKPATGTGNVQGKVLYNSQPAAGIEVKLCEKFNQFFGGCSGEQFTTTTDAAGEYLIKNVPPKIYEGLTAKVFNTNFYVFATTGVLASAKYKIEDGKTYFAPDANLFKDDLRLVTPKAASKLSAGSVEIKWDPYPDAAYYKLSIYADSSSGAQQNYDNVDKRVDGTSFAPEPPLAPGSYRVQVSAYNSNDVLLSESPDKFGFTVTSDVK